MLMLLLLPPLGGGAGDGVDGLPSRLLFVGLAAGAGSAERGKNGGRPREGKVPAAVLAEKRERPRGREGIGVEAVKGDGCFVLMNGGEVAGYGR
jgi:hypothetical protein